MFKFKPMPINEINNFISPGMTAGVHWGGILSIEEALSKKINELTGKQSPMLKIVVITDKMLDCGLKQGITTYIVFKEGCHFSHRNAKKFFESVGVDYPQDGNVDTELLMKNSRFRAEFGYQENKNTGDKSYALLKWLPNDGTDPISENKEENQFNDEIPF